MENNNPQPVVGKKQILRLLRDNELKQIQIATDAEAEYVQSIVAVAKQHNVATVFNGTRQQIADIYGIEVPCGAVGFLKND